MLSSLSSKGRVVSARVAATVAATALATTVGFAGGRAMPSVAAQTPAQALPSHAAPAPPAVAGAWPSYSAVVDRVSPSIVTVRVEARRAAVPAGLPEAFRDFFGGQGFGPGFDGRQAPRTERRQGLGSGVVIRADGYILTNHHVVADAEEVQVELSDRRSLDAKVVGVDPASDLAVLKVETDSLTPMPFGDSDRVKVGDVVLAFGNPLGVGQTVTMGIVGAKGRATGVGDGSYEDFIQTDAPINQGNSGGALVNAGGELIGINAQILSPSGGNIGLGFAIPSGMVRAVTDQIIEHGVVRRAQLGVTVQTVNADLAASLGLDEVRGAIVSGVEPASAAEKAGIQQGDVIVGVDGRDVPDSNSVRNQIASTRPGSSVVIDVVRDGQRQQITAELGEREAAPQARADGGAGATADNESPLGLGVRPVTPQIAEQLGVSPSTAGLEILTVDPDGPAAEVGIRPGDIITQANRRDVRTVEELRAAVAERADRPVLLLVTRDGTSLFVALHPRG